MCHEHIDRVWNRDGEPREREDETPAFLNEEGGDVEVLTDGGDE